MGWALVFSGQGLQHPDMLPWLARDDTVVSLDNELGADWRDRLAVPEGAGHNRRAQVLLTATACAAWAQLQPWVEPPVLVAGYSVGELAAFAAAGVFDARTAVELAGQRADGMDRAAAAATTGLLGITGATAGGLEELGARFDLDIAIRIDAGSGVLGGRRPDLQAATAVALARGWRCTPLNVAMASHTRWMRPAAAAFERVLAGVALQAPALPLFSNALGRVRDAAGARAALARQIAQTVAWDECLDAIAAQRVQAVLEIGPGQALARMWQDRHADVPARSADEFRSAPAIATWLERQLGRG
jgi:[acyl-carrier-protein] S-malonyltransferase